MPDQPAEKKVIGYPSAREFTRRVWIVISCILGTGGVLLFIWFGANLILLLFAGILLALFLGSLSDWVMERTGIGKVGSLLLVVLTLLSIFILAGWLMAVPITRQFNQLSVQVPEALEKIRAYITRFEWGRIAMQAPAPNEILPRAIALVGEAKNLFSVTASAITGFLLIIFIGLYLSLNSRLYLGGFLKLLPIDKRPRFGEVLYEAGGMLRRWLLGQILSMTVIGTVTGIGLHLLGVPLAVILGVLTGILDFIPFVGPFIAGTIAVLLAFMNSPIQALYVGLFFVCMQFLEGHLLIPMVQKRATKLPPVLTLLAMVLFGSWFGFMGVLLATPMLAMIMVFVQKLYIEDVLGDKNPDIVVTTSTSNRHPPESPPP